MIDDEDDIDARLEEDYDEERRRGCERCQNRDAHDDTKDEGQGFVAKLARDQVYKIGTLVSVGISNWY